MSDKKKKISRRIVAFFYKPLFLIVDFFAHQSARLTSFLYYILKRLDWGNIPPTEWMDHDQDYYYQNLYTGHTFYLERGMLPRMIASKFFYKEEDYRNLNISKKLNVLDFCSGDSFISQKFFFDNSENIVSLDLDPLANARGKKRIDRYKYLNKNHHFFKFDVEKDNVLELLKKNNLDIKFDVVLFNAAIEHFKPEELDFMFASLKEAMNSKSFIFTYTIVEDENDPHYLPDHHEMFFNNKEELEKIIKKYFKYTQSTQSMVDTRWNIYCVASNEEISF